ncbi:MAG: hypothetical protein HC842_09445 [Cytophagales bacterium]|nr:hypothetical protein [Cytophagales bacterium]
MDCVSPGTLLTNYAKGLIGDRAEIFNLKFQDLQTPKRYDLVLFSESFQYIPLNESLGKALEMLNPGGHVLICDFFQTEVPGKSMLGGGHKWSQWQSTLAQFPQYRIAVEKDITQETAPTIDLVKQMNNEVLAPLWRSVFALAEDRFPALLKLVRWKYKKKIEKMEYKHFSGERSAENFKKYKKYMLYLLATTPA